MNAFLQRLKQRKLVQWAVAYVAAAFALLQGIDIVAQQFGWPEGLRRGITLAMVVGFFVTLVLAWYHGERGAQRVNGTELLILALLLSLGGGFLWRFTGTARAPMAKAAVEPAAIPSAIAEKSIAVLPFASLSEDKANAYFADGIQDEILTRLSKIADLKVISRTSTQQFQSKPGNLAEIAKQLGVAHILEGSVQKAGEKVRINVQLIKADGDTHLWADTYDRDLTDIFAVESEVAGRIASTLAATLTGREKQDLARIPTANPAAYDAFLHGLALANSQSPEGAEESRQSFRRAVTLDPNFALAWASLASAESLKYFSGHRTPEQLAIARQATDTATKFQPESSEAHAAAGSFYYYCEQDYDRALEELKKARDLSPSSTNAIVMTAMVRRRQGDLHESMDMQMKAAALDPQNADTWVNLGRSYRGLRQFQKAREMYDRALSITPDEESILAQKIETYLAEGDLDSAAQALAPLTIKSTGPLLGDQITVFMLRHDYAGCIAWVQGQLQHQTDPEAELGGHLVIAFCQVLLGQIDTARPELEKILEKLQAVQQTGNANPGLSERISDIQAVLGDRAAVARTAETLLRDSAHDRWQLPRTEETVARAYAILADPDQALPHIERALASPARESLTPAYLRLDPVWDRIRQDPRFQKLAQPAG